MGNSDKLLYQIALTQIEGVGDVIARNLLKIVGDEQLIFKLKYKELIALTHISEKQANAILAPQVLVRAEEEIKFIEKNNISTFFVTDSDYPVRLSECSDAPILLYYKGNAALNCQKIISIVGTRNSTSYGRNYCENFLKELSDIYSDILIISGLAYGIDINVHRAALENKLPTVAVLAHGLDRIYPTQHRNLAIEMLGNGGLLTEFVSKTTPERHNFVRRNRIVAGLADAVIVVESAEKGGSLITAEIANSYCKDVFAVPGRLGDIESSGCNKLIAEHKADLLLSTNYFLDQMGWMTTPTKDRDIRPSTLIFLSEEEQRIIDFMVDKECHIDELSVALCQPVFQLQPILLELELKGAIRSMPGNMFTKDNF